MAADDRSHDGYVVEPFAEPVGNDGWRAGVAVHGDDARHDRPVRSVYADRLFASADEAVAFASSQWGALGAGA